MIADVAGAGPPMPADPVSDDNRPHRGASPYEASDADLFFGRDEEASELIARILGSRLTVLYAPSGAGKTSLLNARIKPMLEARGWFPIGVRFGNDPSEAVRASALRYLLPPLASERAALSDARERLDLNETGTIDHLLGAYASLPTRDPRRRQLVADRDTDDGAHPGLLSPFRRVSPYVCRVLRGSLPLVDLRQHLYTLVTSAPDPSSASSQVLDGIRGISPSMSLGDLNALLSTPPLEHAYNAALVALYLPVPGLDAFFQNLIARYGVTNDTFQIVLILDQFEEIFARYRDPGRRRKEQRQHLPDWRHRERFFQELESLYHAYVSSRDGVADLTPLPIRYVISLREEYVGRLDRVRLFAPELTASMFRLGLLAEEQARGAILGPAEAYQYRYEPSVVTEVWDVLEREGVVAPGPLSIVCDQLWERVISQDLGSQAVDGSAVIDMAALTRAGLVPRDAEEQADTPEVSPVERVISAYFDGFITELPEPEQVDALDILELLITGSGTRNIVDEELLINAPFRSTTRRAAVLEKLVFRKLLRREDRLDGRFVEITHEILIAPMQGRVQAALREARGLRAAERTLEGIRRGDPPELDAADFATLDRYASRFEWPPWSVALMLESAVVHGAPSARLLQWRTSYEAAAWPGVDVLLNQSTAEGRMLALEEVRELEAARARGELPDMRLEDVELIVRSLILAGLGSDRPAIQEWTRLLKTTSHADIDV